MTTVVYSRPHKTMCADSKVSPDGGRMIKIVKHKDTGDLCGIAGSLTIASRFLRAFTETSARRPSSPGSLGTPDSSDMPTLNASSNNPGDSGEALIVRADTGAVEYWDQDGYGEFYDKYYAIGSGNKYALGVLWAGLLPREAIMAASKMDPCTGGRIVTLKLDKEA